MTNLTMPNNLSFMEYPLKSVPGLADVAVVHGDRVGQNSTKMSGGSGKKFQMTNLAMLNNFCVM